MNQGDLPDVGKAIEEINKFCSVIEKRRKKFIDSGQMFNIRKIFENLTKSFNIKNNRKSTNIRKTSKSQRNPDFEELLTTKNLLTSKELHQIKKENFKHMNSLDDIYNSEDYSKDEFCI